MGKLLEGEDIFPDECFGVIWDVIGDLEHHANVMHLPHWRNEKPCWMCDTSAAEALDWRREASWRRTIFTATQQAEKPARQHPLFRALHIAGLNDAHVKPGNMHSIELGVLLYLHGGSLKSLIDAPTTSILGRSRQARLVHVWQRIRHHYRRRRVPHQIRHWRLSHFMPETSSEFPALKAKAAPSKDLVPVMVDVCREFDSGTALDRHRLMAYECINEFFQLMRTTREWVPPPGVAHRANRFIEQFLLHYKFVATHEAAQGRFTFNQTFKYHLTAHIGDNCRFENPLKSSEYPYEDLVGKLARVGQACTASAAHTRIGFKIMAKVRRVMALSLASVAHARTAADR